MIARSEVALFLWSLVPAGTKMEDVTWCQLSPPPSSFAQTNQHKSNVSTSGGSERAVLTSAL